MAVFSGRFLVQGHSSASAPKSATTNATTTATSPLAAAASATTTPSTVAYPLLVSNVSLSFWGGLDPVTGVVIDTSHPLCGHNVADTIFCLPSGRGSCTASQVLLELILNHKAPRAIVLRDDDVMVSVGALVAQEVFQHEHVPDILVLGTEQFQHLLQQQQKQQEAKYGVIQKDGSFVCYDKEDDNIVLYHHQPTINNSPSKSQTSAGGHNGTTDAVVTTIDWLDSIDLTQEEQDMLASAKSRSQAQLMATRVLIRYAHMTNPTPSYRTVTKAHIDGCTYIGPGGLEFVQRLVQTGGSVAVPTTLNAVSADRRQWSALGVPEPYAKASMALGDAYLALQCQPSFTCAPYLLPHAAPSLGEDVVWGESNAVVFANSVLGARTEKYADYLDICCAIVGKVAAAGVHLEHHRRPKKLLDATKLAMQLQQQVQDGDGDKAASVTMDLELLFPALGHLCGTASDGQVPLLVGFESWQSFITRDHLKAFCAAFGTTGTSPLVHIAGITPEAKDPAIVEELRQNCGSEGPPVELSLSMLEETFKILDSGGRRTTDNSGGDDDKVDLIALGNPHLSVSECQRLAELVTMASKNNNNNNNNNNKKHPHVRIMACMSRILHAQAQELGFVDPLTKFGVEFVHDTCWCMLLDPPVIPWNVSAKILTNSGKYAHYGPGLTQRQFRFGSMEDCVHAAITGLYPRKDSPTTTTTMTAIPTWLTRQQKRTYVTWNMSSTLAATRDRNLARTSTAASTKHVAAVMARGVWYYFAKKL